MKIRYLSAPLALLFFGLAVPAHAATAVFVCATELPGGSQSADYTNCIEAALAAETAFLEGNRPQFRDLRFSAIVGSQTLPLRRELTRGQPLPQVKVSIVRGGFEGQESYFELKLLDVLVSAASLEFSEVGDGIPRESFSLRPTRVEYAFRGQLIDGGFGPWVFLCVDYTDGTSIDGECG